MALNTYSSALVMDPATGHGVAGVILEVTDLVTGVPVTTYDVNGVKRQVVTNSKGYTGTFYTDDTVGQVLLQTGGITLPAIAKEVISASVDAAKIAQAAAEAAAALVDAPAGTVVRSVVEGDLGATDSTMKTQISGIARDTVQEDLEASGANGIKNQIVAIAKATLDDELSDDATASGSLIRKLAAIRNPYVEGVPLYSLGHSYTMYPYPYGTQYTGEYYMRLKQRLKLGDVYPIGRSATIAIDNFGRLLSDEYDDGKAYWTPGQRGIALIQNTMNELGSSLAPDATFRGMWKMGIMGEIALISSGETKGVPQASATSGTWTRHNNVESKKGLNGETYFASAAAWVEWTFSGTEVFVVAPISTTYALNTWSVTVDGAAKLTNIAATGMKSDYTDAVTGASMNYTPGIWRISGLSSGAHTLRFTRGTTGNTFVHGIIIPSATPPQIFLAKEPPRAGSGASIYNANVGWYNAEIDNFAATFSNVTAVDLAPGWDNSTMISSLDVAGGSFHPNDKGHSLMADHFAAAINTKITSWMNGVVVL